MINSIGSSNVTGAIRLTNNVGVGTNTITTIAINAAASLNATLTAADFIATGAALTISGAASALPSATS